MSVLRALSKRLGNWLARTSRFDGRILVASFVGLYLLIIGLAAWGGVATQAWKVFGVGSMKPAFADARVVTVGWENYRRGFNPLYLNPGDSGANVLNYPRIWLLPSCFGWGERHTVWVACSAAAAYFLMVLLVAGPLTRGEAFVWTLLLCAPAAMLAVERGNNDLVVFTVLVLGLLLLQRHRLTAYGLLLLAALLKLYPVVALVAVIREQKYRALVVLGSLAFIFVSYIFLTLSDIVQISSCTPRPTFWAYGCMTFADKISESLRFRGHHIGVWPRALAMLAVVAVSVVAIRSGRRIRQQNRDTSFSLDGFRAGAAVYLGTFLIGNNWIYRLIFLLLAIPQLLAWIKKDKERQFISAVCVVCLLGTMWSPLLLLKAWPLRFIIMPPVEVANWTLFGGLIVLFYASLPSWVVEFLPFRLSTQESRNAQARTVMSSTMHP